MSNNSMIPLPCFQTSISEWSDIIIRVTFDVLQIDTLTEYILAAQGETEKHN